MKFWSELKPYFNLANLLSGLLFAGLAMWSLGSFSWTALIFVHVLTVGVPLLRARNDQSYLDRD